MKSEPSRTGSTASCSPVPAATLRPSPTPRPVPSPDRLRSPTWRCPQRHRSGCGGFPGLARYLAVQPHPDHVPLPGGAQRAQARGGEADHRRTRQGVIRRARRDQSWPRGRRVRLWHAPSAQGRHDGERLRQRRRLLAPPTARAGRHHQSVQLSGHGPDVVLPHRDRGGQHRRPQTQREGPLHRPLVGRAVGRGGTTRRRVQRPAGR